MDNALDWLRLLQKRKVDKAHRYHFDALPLIEGRGGFTNYRLMIDNETEDVSCWEEYRKPDYSYYLFGLGDFIVKEKPYN